jgi:hypothetical protein
MSTPRFTHLAFPLAALSLALIAGSVARGADSASDSAGVRQVVVVTATDERIAGPLVEFKGSALTLGSQPPRLVDLLDLQSLAFDATAMLSVQWIGQDQHDFVQVGAPQSGNGIQDVHIRLRGLSNQKQIKQLRLLVRTPPQAWLLDPTNSPNWRLMVQRSGNSGTADVYFEPPGADLFDKELQMTLTYSDDSTDKLTCKAATHTSDQLKVGASTPAGEADRGGNIAAAVDFGIADQLHGALAQLTEETLSLKTAWQTTVDIPLLNVQGLCLKQASPDAKRRYDAARAKPPSDDLAIVLAKDGSLAEIAGRVKAWDGHQLQFVYEGKEQTISGDRLQAIVLAARPASRPAAAPYQVVHLSSDDTLSGAWQAMTAGNVSLKMPWGASWEIPVDSVVDIGTRNGNLVHLSDMEPATADQTPYFGRLLSYRRDQSLDGGSLKMKGKVYSKGLAVHSRCILSYPLDGQFTTFKTTVGFDDAAGNRGNVACRVLADGKELFSKADLRADQDPQLLEFPVPGVKLLSLEVDFGENEDIGDRVIWAEARLFRK